MSSNFGEGNSPSAESFLGARETCREDSRLEQRTVQTRKHAFENGMRSKRNWTKTGNFRSRVRRVTALRSLGTLHKSYGSSVGACTMSDAGREKKIIFEMRKHIALLGGGGEKRFKKSSDSRSGAHCWLDVMSRNDGSCHKLRQTDVQSTFVRSYERCQREVTFPDSIGAERSAEQQRKNKSRTKFVSGTSIVIVHQHRSGTIHSRNTRLE